MLARVVHYTEFEYNNCLVLRLTGRQYICMCVDEMLEKKLIDSGMRAVSGIQFIFMVG